MQISFHFSFSHTCATIGFQAGALAPGPFCLWLKDISSQCVSLWGWRRTHCLSSWAVGRPSLPVGRNAMKSEPSCAYTGLSNKWERHPRRGNTGAEDAAVPDLGITRLRMPRMLLANCGPDNVVQAALRRTSVPSAPSVCDNQISHCKLRAQEPHWAQHLYQHLWCPRHSILSSVPFHLGGDLQNPIWVSVSRYHCTLHSKPPFHPVNLHITGKNKNTLSGPTATVRTDTPHVTQRGLCAKPGLSTGGRHGKMGDCQPNTQPPKQQKPERDLHQNSWRSVRGRGKWLLHVVCLHRNSWHPQKRGTSSWSQYLMLPNSILHYFWAIRKHSTPCL